LPNKSFKAPVALSFTVFLISSLGVVLVFEVSVQINFELERVILGFGESIKIIQPTKLKKKIIHKLRIAYKNYEE
jgi:predicted DNA-binding transcriptional regulator YafY